MICAEKKKTKILNYSPSFSSFLLGFDPNMQSWCLQHWGRRGEATNRRHEKQRRWHQHHGACNGFWLWGTELELELVAIGRQESGSWFWFWSTCLSVSQRSDQIDAPVDSVHLKLPQPQLLSLDLYSFPALSTGWTFQRVVYDALILVVRDTAKCQRVEFLLVRLWISTFLPSKTKNQQTTFTTTVCRPRKS